MQERPVIASVRVISEDLSLGRILVATLQAHGYSATVASLGLDEIRELTRLLPDVVVLQLPSGVVGHAYLSHFRMTEFSGRVVIVTAEEEVARPEALTENVRLLRPWQLDEILSAIRSLAG
jgi:DNA-binding response OmpR family regulator